MFVLGNYMCWTVYCRELFCLLQIVSYVLGGCDYSFSDHDISHFLVNSGEELMLTLHISILNNLGKNRNTYKGRRKITQNIVYACSNTGSRCRRQKWTECKRKLINAHRWYVGFNTPILESDRQRRRKIRKI